MGRISRRLRQRIWLRVGLAGSLILAAAVAITLHVVNPAQASHATTTEYGAGDAQVQAALTAAGWPQQQNNWCGVATVAGIANFGGHSISQSSIASYLNSAQSESAWGTPSYNGLGPGFTYGDIARDGGSDPRSIAAALTYAAGGQQTYHQVVDLRNVSDATQHLVNDVVRAQAPLSVVVLHGQHLVLVSGVYATGDPGNLSNVTGLVVWDPGAGSSFGGIQSAQKEVVSLNTWMTSQNYWGASYNANYFGSLPYDPDPAVGPYTYDSSKGDNAHLWIGHYVYLRPDASGDPETGVNPDWAFDQYNQLIEGFHGELPAGYTGPTTPIPTTLVMGDESIDSPALWSESAYQAAGSSAPVSVLAWAGTDSAHHLNISMSTDGLHYSQKITLGDTSFTRPSVLMTTVNNTNAVVIAWAGTDSAHHLNVMYDAYGARHKITLGQTSGYAPSLAEFGGQVWLAWTGTDSNHTLNVIAMGPQGTTPGAKTTLWGRDAGSSPALATDTQDNALLLTWQYANSPTHHLNFVQSSDGATWTAPLASPSPQTSPITPSLMVVNTPASGVAPYYWAWTGMDGARSLNLVRSSALNSWQGPVNTFSQSSLSAPVLGYAGQAHQILLVWTGTDSQHHMNIAIIPV